MRPGLVPAAAAAALLLLAAAPPPAGAHEVAAVDAYSRVLAHGDAYSDTAHTAGVVPYHCHLHPGMVGILRVLPGTAPGGSTTIRIAIQDDGNATHLGAMRFLDAAGGNQTVAHVGDTLLWVNEGQLLHDLHIAWSWVAPVDNGSFELWIAAGLVIALTAIMVAARRT